MSTEAVSRQNSLVNPRVRQGFKPLSNSESPFKRTEEKNAQLISPLSEDFRFEAGVETPAGLLVVPLDEAQRCAVKAKGRNCLDDRN